MTKAQLSGKPSGARPKGWNRGEPVKRAGQTIGWLDRQKQVYRIVRNYPKDVARRHDAYGIDVGSVERFNDWGVETVMIEERRGHTIREIPTPATVWLEAFVDKLGDNGLPHAFVRLSSLPDGRVIRNDSCRRCCTLCSARCMQNLGHQKGGPHECLGCGNTTRR